MMWKKIKIKNFQIHKNLEISLKTGVNIIAGSSDSGKSSLIRAATALLTNKDFSQAYATWGGKENQEMSISITSDEIEVSRFRNKIKNGYKIDGKELLATRGVVPQEVQDIFKMNDVNIGSQYEPFFLLSSSSGEIARRIQDFCDLSLIQKTIQKADSFEKEAKSNLKKLEEQKQEVNEKIKSLDWLEAAEKELKKVKIGKRRIEELQEEANEYKILVEKKEKIEIILKECAPILAFEPSFLELQAKAHEWEEKRRYHAFLANVWHKARERKERIEQAEKAKAICSFQPRFEALKEEYEKLQTKIIKRLDLENLKNNFNEISKRAQEYKVRLEKLKKEEKETKKELKICPTCGKEL